MQTLRDIIERHSEENSEFRYYIPIIEKAERNEVDHPDITIECCASLFQGLSKTIVKRLDPATFQDDFEGQPLQRQVRLAFRCLAAGDDAVELGFPIAAENLVRVVGTLRNQRGDISHGRAAPKELQSDRSLARLVLNVSEPLMRYMLATFFALQPQRVVVPPYADNAAFNAFLDELHPLTGKPLYSRALYDQFSEDYVIQLREFEDLAAARAEEAGEGSDDD